MSAYLEKMAEFSALLRREGQCFHGRARVRRPPEGGEVLEKRQRRSALQRAWASFTSLV